MKERAVRILCLAAFVTLISGADQVLAQSFDDAPFSNVVGRYCSGKSGSNFVVYQPLVVDGKPVVRIWVSKEAPIDTTATGRDFPVKIIRGNSTFSFVNQSRTAEFEVVVTPNSISGSSFFDGRSIPLSTECKPK